MKTRSDILKLTAKDTHHTQVHDKQTTEAIYDYTFRVAAIFLYYIIHEYVPVVWEAGWAPEEHPVTMGQEAG
jgi:hypothetical protein